MLKYIPRTTSDLVEGKFYKGTYFSGEQHIFYCVKKSTNGVVLFNLKEKKKYCHPLNALLIPMEEI